MIVVAVGTSVIVSLVLTRGAEPDVAVLEAAGRTDLVKKHGGGTPEREDAPDGQDPATGGDAGKAADGDAARETDGGARSRIPNGVHLSRSPRRGNI